MLCCSLPKKAAYYSVILCLMWPHSGVDLGPIKMANIPDDRVVSKIVDCCQIDDVNQSCEYRIIYLSFLLKRCLIIESILILSRIQQANARTKCHHTRGYA